MGKCQYENDIDMATNKYLLMLVHAPMHFQPEEIVSSVELGFHEFEQRFEVVCSLSFPPLSSLPNQSDQVSAYFEMFSKGSLDDNKYKDCGSLETFLVPWLSYSYADAMTASD